MSLTLSAHTARTLSEIEKEMSSQRSSTSLSDKETAVEDQQTTNSKTVSCHSSAKEEVQENNKKDTKDDIMDKKKRRRLIFRRISYIVIMNAVIPIVLYYILKNHLPAVWALVLSSTPTIISVIVQAIFLKRIDSIGVAVIFGFILSVVLAVVNGDPKILLMRESFVTAGVGVVCAITLLPIKYKTFSLKPVLHYIASDLIPLEPVYFLDESKPPQKRMDFYWHNSAFCRFHFRLLTAIDVVILELEFGLKLFYILTFDLDTVVILSNTTLSVIGILVSLSTIGYMLQIRKRLRKDERQMLIDAMAKLS